MELFSIRIRRTFQLVSTVQTAFPYCRIRQIDCNVIAKDGGALHCITWNIKKS